MRKNSEMGVVSGIDGLSHINIIKNVFILQKIRL